jgi:hypothetical protein
MIEYSLINCIRFRKWVKVIDSFQYEGRELFIHKALNGDIYVVSDVLTGMSLAMIKGPSQNSAIRALKKKSKQIKLAFNRPLALKSWELNLKHKKSHRQYLKEQKQRIRIEFYPSIFLNFYPINYNEDDIPF